MGVEALQAQATIHQRQTLVIRARLLDGAGNPIVDATGAAPTDTVAKALAISIFDLTDSSSSHLDVYDPLGSGATGSVEFQAVPSVGDTLDVSDGTTVLTFTIVSAGDPAGYVSGEDYKVEIGVAANPTARTAQNLLSVFTDTTVGAGGGVAGNHPSYGVTAAADTTNPSAVLFSNAAGGSAGNVALVYVTTDDPPAALLTGMSGGTDGQPTIAQVFRSAAAPYSTEGWRLSGPGYNFALAIPNTAVFWKGGHRYRVEALVTYDDATIFGGSTGTSSGPVILHVDVDVLSAFSAAD